MIVSDHAAKRIRQRVGIPKRSVQKWAERAWREGLPMSDGGTLGRYMRTKWHRGGEHGTWRAYGSHALLCNKGILVTVMSIPGHVVASGGSHE